MTDPPRVGYGSVWCLVMRPGQGSIIVCLAGMAMLAGACGSPSKPVSFILTDAATNVPLAHARLRACPLSTNSIPLPVSLKNLRESSEGLKVSASTDEQGLATLRLYRDLPSLIEVMLWVPASPSENPPAEWIYDPRDRSLTRTHFETHGGDSQPSIRLELAGR